MVEVERFDITRHPEHGRPRVVEFRSPAGKLVVHCSRDDGSLWMFAVGPAGGDRGQVILPVRRVADVEAWVDGNRTTGLGGGKGYLLMRGDFVLVRRIGVTRDWRMEFDAEGREELLTVLREWAAAVRAAQG